jgi:hypothetical protein
MKYEINNKIFFLYTSVWLLLLGGLLSSGFEPNNSVQLNTYSEQLPKLLFFPQVFSILENGRIITGI